LLKNYFKIAWRNIINQKLHSLINIGGLSVAMAAAVLIMMWVQNELSFDSYHEASDRIYLVKSHEYADKNNIFTT
jgi:putative ABC transport system permease protein